MKRELTILLLIWSAVMLCDAGKIEGSVSGHAAIRPAAFSAGHEKTFETDITPLLATAVQGTSHLTQEAETFGKNDRHASHSFAAHFAGTPSRPQLRPHSETGRLEVPRPNMRSGERYLYFLCRIII